MQGSIQINYSQVIPLTKEELRETYSKLSKEELIEMLIANNSFWGFVKPQVFVSPATIVPPCQHQWMPLPSLTTGINRYQCFKCGAVMQSSVEDCISTNSYQRITNK